MKKILKSFLFTMAFLLIICNQGVANVFAAPNVKLEGNADGIVFIPGDGPFLSASNMLPGDRVERNIILKNRSDSEYKIFMRAERKTKEEKYDLLKVIDLAIDYEKNQIYNGPVTGENGLEKNIYLGIVNPGETKTLQAVVELEGKATGNEYKNKYGRVDWIFTAVKMPSAKTIENGEENPVVTPSENPKTPKIEKTQAKVPYTGDQGVQSYIAVLAICTIILLVVNRKVKVKK